MKRCRIILSGLYLLMMVLLPHWHLVLEHHTAPAFPETTCNSHGHDHDAPPANDRNPLGDHEACGLCDLLLLTCESPQIDTTLYMASCPELIPEEPATFLSSFRRTLRRARAPPCMTV